MGPQSSVAMLLPQVQILLVFATSNNIFMRVRIFVPFWLLNADLVVTSTTSGCSYLWGQLVAFDLACREFASDKPFLPSAMEGGGILSHSFGWFLPATFELAFA